MAKGSKTKVVTDQGPLGWIFFTAWIGALVYFITIAAGFWGIVLAFLKSIVWPAFLIYYALQALGVQ